MVRASQSRLPGLCFVLCALAAACGGRTGGAGGTGGSDAAGADDGSAAGDGMTATDGAASDCVSESGYALCGGTRDCFPPQSRGKNTPCWDCAAQGYGYQTVVCDNSVVPTGEIAGLSPDGHVYVEAYVPNAWEPFPFDVGQLFADNGASDRVRYADWSAWTGAPLPAPATCPQPQGFSICGGNCGPCNPGQKCTGRSPAHPYGLCATLNSPSWFCQASGSCPTGQGCVVFTVPPADQPIADKGGICFPADVCQAIAAQYPGGATCHPTK